MPRPRALLFALAWLFAGTIALLTIFGAVITVLYSAGIVKAEPYRLELLGGGCRLSASGDGVWHNSNYPHDVSNRSMTSNCYQVGVSKVTHRSARTSYGWRFAYVDFGTVRWRGVWPVVDAEQFTVNPSGDHCDYPNSFSGCVASGRHYQSESGVSVGYFGERRIGPVEWGAELGGFLYYGRFGFRIESWPEPNVFAGREDYAGWQFTPYAGATARYGFLFTQFRVYASVKAAKHGCGNCSGVSSGPGRQLLFGISRPF